MPFEPCAFLLPIVVAFAPQAPAAERHEAEIGAACVDCHGELVASYRASPMAQALRPLRPKEVDELVGVHDDRTGFRYFFEDQGKRSVVVERWYGPDGEEVPECRNGAELVFAIGAGVADTSYAALRGGMLWFAPIELLTGTAQAPRHAALAPGHLVQPTLRFSVGISDECLACHTDALPPKRFPLNLHVPEWKPRGIDCAHCHPGAAEHAQHQGTNAEGPDPLAALALDTPIERLSSCARCHLQGDARVPLSNDLAEHRAPGGDLLDKVAVFTGSDANGEILFVSQTERLVASKCFTASFERAASGGRALTCETCHDPHRSVFEPRERDAVRAACTRCHAPEDARVDGKDAPCSRALAEREGRACVDCHSRRTEPLDVHGVEIFDHKIERVPLAPSRIETLRIKQATTGELRRFRWPGRSVRFDGADGAAGDPGLLLLAEFGANRFERARAKVDEKPDAAIERLAIYHHVRGGLLSELGRSEDARKSYARALVLDPDSAASKINLGLVLSELGRAEEGVKLLDRVLAAHPRAEGALRNRALAKLAKGDALGARRDLEAAHVILPNAATARALAELARRAGDEEATERWLRAALVLDPLSR